MTFDLRTLSIGETANMPVRDATGEPQFDADNQPITITLYGPGTKKFQRAKHALEERQNARTVARMQNKGEKQSADDKNQERAEFLASVTVSINGASVGDKVGHEAFKALYADITLGHIADDADKFLADRGNFKAASPKV